MSSGKDIAHGPSRQVEFADLIKLVESIRSAAPTAPAIVPDGIYTRAQVEANLGIGDTNLTGWNEFHGLRPIQPGTRAQFYLGSELIAWMVTNRDGITKPKTSKEKAAARAKIK